MDTGEKKSLRKGYIHRYRFPVLYQELPVCASCSWMCFSPCSAFLRNPLPGCGHWVCLCSDDHHGDSCDYLSTPSEESTREEDRGDRHWTVRTGEREKGFWNSLSNVSTWLFWIIGLGPCTKHLQCKTANSIIDNCLCTCTQNRAPGWTSFGFLILLLPVAVAPHSDKDPSCCSGGWQMTLWSPCL